MQTFEKLISGDYLYVDKTRDIYNLLAGGGQYYFISRPRRFGKSLLISTLKELFSGNRELFKGLWIHDKIQWQKYPVIHMSFLGLKYNNPEELNRTLEFLIDQNAQTYGIQLKQQGFDQRFNELIRELAREAPVVILIDEYDKPIIDNIENREIAKQNRDILRTFYETVKGSDEFLKFCFITGVSKFSKVSVFSGLNNLNDITMDARYATMLGYTEDELLRYFPVNGPDSPLADRIKRWYNGYSWDGVNFVYNPLSILLYFEKKAFKNYWFSTGTPSFLVKAITEKDIPAIEFERTEVDDTTFESFDIGAIEVTSLLFQTGYLTIKEKNEYDEETLYTLSYPNREVRESFLKHLLKGFTETRPSENLKTLKSVKEALKEGDLDGLFKTIQTLFSSISYNMFVAHREGYYQTVIYLVLRLAGITIQTEKETNIGRIDAVAETGEHIYILEFKIGSSEEALAQIKEKKYYQPFLASGKGITMVGIGIDTGERNLLPYCSEPVPS